LEYLIDTSTLIAAERGCFDLDEKLRSHGSAAVYVSVITVSELLHGVERAADPVRRLRRSEFVENLLNTVTIVEIDLQIARIHAQLWAHVAAAGQVIGAHDLWIAATCIARGMRVVTSNLREFERVPGLDVEFWQLRS
jgi:tRNA(fMet)-specific endonuclease VapC